MPPPSGPLPPAWSPSQPQTGILPPDLEFNSFCQAARDPPVGHAVHERQLRIEQRCRRRLARRVSLPEGAVKRLTKVPVRFQSRRIVRSSAADEGSRAIGEKA